MRLSPLLLHIFLILLLTAQKAACKQKTDHLESVVDGIFASVALLQSLKEVDSKVDLLRLLTLTIEVLGDKAEPYLHRIATTLPAVSLYYSADLSGSCLASFIEACLWSTASLCLMLATCSTAEGSTAYLV